MKKSGDKVYMNRVPLNMVDATRDYKSRNRINAHHKDYGFAKVADIYPKLNLKQVDVVPNPNFAVGSTVYIDKYGVKQHSPIPINMLYELNIQTKSKNDSTMIIEQILPYLRPHFVVTIKEIVNGKMNRVRDLKLVYQTTSINNDTMGELDGNDIYDWSIIFEMVGYLYPPQIEASEQGNIIETVFLNFKQQEVILVEDGFYESNPENMPNELTPSGEFESVDLQVDGYDEGITKEEWEDGGHLVNVGMSKDIMVPQELPSEVRRGYKNE